MLKDIVMLTGQAVLMTDDQHQDITCLLEETWCHGEARNNRSYLDQLLKLNIRNLLSELKVMRKCPSRLHCDNKSALNIANNPIQHDRTKHVEIDRFL
jgi:hypothetical protein